MFSPVTLATFVIQPGVPGMVCLFLMDCCNPAAITCRFWSSFAPLAALIWRTTLGERTPARMARIASTPINSINVKPARKLEGEAAVFIAGSSS